MRIKSRKEKLSEYNIKYKNKTFKTEDRIREYFDSRGWNLDKAIEKAKTKLKTIIDQRQYESIHIIMYEYPMKTDRPRTARNHIYSPNAASNKSYFGKAIKQIVDDIKLINTPSEIKIEAYLEMPKQVPPDEVILFEAKVLNVLDKPDYDNIGKCYTDILQDILIIDDDIFYHGDITKYYSLLPRVEILITYLTKHESTYVYKKIKNRKFIKKGIKTGQITLDKIEYSPKFKKGVESNEE